MKVAPLNQASPVKVVVAERSVSRRSSRRLKRPFRSRQFSKDELDEVRVGEVKVDIVPELPAVLRDKVIGEDALASKSDLAFLDPFLVFRAVGLPVLAGWRVGHAQVGADDVDDALSLPWVVVGEPFESVEAGQTHRSLSRAELVGGLGVQLGDVLFGRVALAVPLAPHRQQKREDARCAGADAESGLDRVDPRGTGSFAAVASPSSQLGRDPRHETTTIAAATTTHQLIPEARVRGACCPRSRQPAAATLTPAAANSASGTACGRAHRPNAGQSTHPNSTVIPVSSAAPPSTSAPRAGAQSSAGRRGSVGFHFVTHGQSPPGDPVLHPSRAVRADYAGQRTDSRTGPVACVVNTVATPP